MQVTTDAFLRWCLWCLVLLSTSECRCVSSRFFLALLRPLCDGLKRCMRASFVRYIVVVFNVFSEMFHDSVHVELLTFLHLELVAAWKNGKPMAYCVNEVSDWSVLLSFGDLVFICFRKHKLPFVCPFMWILLVRSFGKRVIVSFDVLFSRFYAWCKPLFESAENLPTVG